MTHMANSTVQFGFVCHPLDYSDLYRFEPDYRGQPLDALEEIRLRSKPVLLGGFDGIRLPQGGEISGLLFSILFLPHEILRMSPSQVRKRLVNVAKLARDAGCVNLGLGSYWSVWGNGGLSLARRTALPVTSGATLSAVSTVATIERACQQLDKDLASQQVSIVGASGAIGRLMTYLLRTKVASLSLVGRRPQALTQVAESFELPAYQAHTSLADGVRDCGVVIFCTNSPGDMSDECELADDCLVCDVSRPRNFSRSSMGHGRRMTVIDGGLVRPPGMSRTTFDIRLPRGLVYPCVAETMILAAKGVTEPFSLGRKVPVGHLEKMRQWAEELGFETSEPLSFGSTLRQQVEAPT